MPYFAQKHVYHVLAERGSAISRFRGVKSVKSQNSVPTFRSSDLQRHNCRNSGSSFRVILRLAACTTIFPSLVNHSCCCSFFLYFIGVVPTSFLKAWQKYGKLFIPTSMLICSIPLLLVIKNRQACLIRLARI
ncbi:hypothetical protein QFZ80_001697 [Paenibacillus sp. V4I7]|nr:hypothetical protein [Paenibacillus sp. V4I7]MDQ0916135.1 hypothetical protein [Paenibacillus sp. V4I5]